MVSEREYRKAYRKRRKAAWARQLAERAAEIAAVKAILLSAHRLRAIGVRPHG